MQERYEIRWHGRGGQGAVTAGVLVAEAAILDGKYAQAYPEFGAERRGAPVKAYTKVSEKPIYSRSPIINPDIVVVLDPSINKSIYMDGLKEGGMVLINSSKSDEEVKALIGRSDVKIAVVDATHIALDILKSAIVNTAMVGALVKVVPLATLESLEKALHETFSKKVADLNYQIVKTSYEKVKIIN